MSGESHSDSKVIESKADLVEWFRGHCTPADELLIGVEHEKPPFYLDNHAPVPYAGVPGRPGLRELFKRMAARRHWKPGYEQGKLVELEKDRVKWSLEPGGQVETGG